MTNKQHPITPPFELMNQWYKKACKDPYNGGKFIMAPVLKDISNSAAQWGADQELNACCEWLSWRISRHMSEQLRDTRRAKPLTLKQQALTILDDCSDRLDGAHENILRKALEQLND